MVVSFATMPDDTALHADWILPDAHFLEQWDLQTTPQGVALSGRQPLAAGAAAGRSTMFARSPRFFLELARRCGARSRCGLSVEGRAGPTAAEMEGLYEQKRGAIMGTTFDEAWVRMMEGAGWWAPGYRSAEELWKKSLETGGWWDPFYDHGDWTRVLKNSLRAFRVPGRRSRAAPESGLGRTSPKGRAPIPSSLVLFEPLAVAGGTGAELPFLQAILDPGYEERWETWAEIHTETAASLGIAGPGLGDGFLAPRRDRGAGASGTAGRARRRGDPGRARKARRRALGRGRRGEPPAAALGGARALLRAARSRRDPGARHEGGPARIGQPPPDRRS